jgi:hypothetical protein
MTGRSGRISPIRRTRSRTLASSAIGSSLMVRRTRSEMRSRYAPGTPPRTRVLVRPGHEDARVHRNRRHRRPRAVEERHARVEPVGDLGALEHVRDERLAREPAAAPPAPDGRHPAQGRRLVVVARRVRPALQASNRYPLPTSSLWPSITSGRGGPPRPIETTPGSNPPARATSPGTRNRGLPNPLARPDDGQEGFVETSRNSGGLSSKSLPTYRAPAASAWEAMRILSR